MKLQNTVWSSSSVRNCHGWNSWGCETSPTHSCLSKDLLCRGFSAKSNSLSRVVTVIETCVCVHDLCISSQIKHGLAFSLWCQEKSLSFIYTLKCSVVNLLVHTTLFFFNVALNDIYNASTLHRTPCNF